MYRELPDFFWPDRLTPINFYGYTSSVRDRFYEVKADDSSNASNVQRFMDLKRKCMAMCVDMNAEEGGDPSWSKDVWDNKVVIECKTETGGIVFVGFYDFTYSLGLSMYSRDGRTARPYKVVEHPKELSEA